VRGQQERRRWSKLKEWLAATPGSIGLASASDASLPCPDHAD
jgi:hypothetical protein